MARGMLWGDSGECQLNVLLDSWLINDEIARSHVLYYAIARTIHRLSSLDAARSANLVSALAGAFTVANIAWLSAAMCRKTIAVVCASLLILLSHSLWQLSTSAEVVTLSTALLTAELIAVTRWVESKRLRWLAAVAFVNGLGLSNHNFALLMWPVYALALLRFRTAWVSRWPSLLGTVAPAWLVGAAPVLALCISDWWARGSLRGTLESFLVGHYGTQVSNLANLPKLLGRSAAIAALNFPTPLILLSVVGVMRFRHVCPPAITFVMLGGAAVYLAFGCRYDVPDQNAFLVPAFLFAPVFAAVGVDYFLERKKPRLWGFAFLLLSCPGPAIYAATPWLIHRFALEIPMLPQRAVPYRDRYEWFLRPWRAGYDGAERFARETLESLPKDAALIVDGTMCMPLNYLQVATGLRRDVRLDSTHPYQPWQTEPMSDLIRQEKISAGIYFAASQDERYLPKWFDKRAWTLEPHGHVFRVRVLQRPQAGPRVPP